MHLTYSMCEQVYNFREMPFNVHESGCLLYYIHFSSDEESRLDYCFVEMWFNVDKAKIRFSIYA